MADWDQLEIDVGSTVEPLTDSLSSSVQGIVSIVQTGAAILDVLSSFLVVGQSPVLAAIKQLLGEVQQFLDSIADTGVNSLFMVPSNLEELTRYKGGFGKYEQLFLESIHDVEDPERPQFSSNSTVGGLFISLDTDSPGELILNLLKIYRFFNRRFELKYPAPVNVKMRPADNLGFPSDQLLNIFTENGLDLNKLRLEWQEPRVSNDIFLDIFASNKFYIERSKRREGKLELQEETPKTRKNPAEKKQEESGKEKRFYAPSVDKDGDPIYHWEPLDPADPFVDVGDTLDIAENRINFLSGSYAYVIDDAEKGIENAYYYRVRSVPTEATLESREALVLNARGEAIKETVYDLKVEGERINKYAPPSVPVLGALPDIDASFDLPTALLNLYRAAYLLRFDVEYTLPNGDTALGPELLEPAVSESFYDSLENAEIYGFDTLVNGTLVSDEINYWPEDIFESNSDILDYVDTEANLKEALVEDAQAFDPFGGVDEFLSPRSSLEENERVRLAIDRLAERKVEQLTTFLAQNEGLFETFQQLYLSVQSDIDSILTSGVSESELIESGSTRANIYSLLQLVEGGAKPGIPPNWEQVKAIDDLLPFIRDYSDKIIDLITSFTNVLQSTLDDLKGTIDSLRDRLAVITAILDILDEVIGLLDALADITPEFNALFVPPSSGGNAHLISEFLNSGNKPERNPNGYMAGFVFVFGGPSGADVSGVANAFRLLFGL